MDTQVIENFLTVVQEGNISRAARALHITQPTLSRQLKDLETKLGAQLFERGSREIKLTEEGKIFLKRAQEITTLIQRAQDEIHNRDISGDIYIGAGETHALSHIGKVIKAIQEDNPGIRFHIISGDKEDLLERLDNGLFDFCLIFGDFNGEKYDYLELPFTDNWVLISLKDIPIKDKIITSNDLKDLPLLVSRQSLSDSMFENLFNLDRNSLNIVATYNLVNNAILLAKQGVGSVVTLDNLVNTKGTNLITRKIQSKTPTKMFFIWKKNNRFNQIMEIFMEHLKAEIKKTSK